MRFDANLRLLVPFVDINVFLLLQLLLVVFGLTTEINFSISIRPQKRAPFFLAPECETSALALKQVLVTSGASDSPNLGQQPSTSSTPPQFALAPPV